MDEDIKEKPIKQDTEKQDTEPEDYVVIIRGGFAVTVANAKSKDWAEGRALGEMSSIMKQIGFQVSGVETLKKSEIEKRN